MTDASIDRRTVLLGSAVVGAGAVLAACGGGNAPAAAAAGVVGPAADVPVGGGVIYGRQRVVVTQPTEKVFKAFSAVCPHAGCLVAEVKPTGILCRCHGSLFSVKDGSVLAGPADAGLEAKTVTVAAGTLTVG